VSRVFRVPTIVIAAAPRGAWLIIYRLIIYRLRDCHPKRYPSGADAGNTVESLLFFSS
jgi:hypothetical protein